MRDRPAPPAFYEELIENAFDFICAFDTVGTITFANESSRVMLGWSPDQMIGRSVAEFVHPDDLERALAGVMTSADYGAPAGTSSFRLLCADDSWAEVDLTASNVAVDDGLGSHMAVFCRPADYQHATDLVLQLLLSGGASTAETLAPVLDVFAWQPNGSMIAIAWFEQGRGHQHVSTGLPVELTGAEDDPGGPWARARSSGEGAHEESPDALDPSRARAARALGRGSLWVEPVDDVAGDVCALVTVFVRDSGRPATGHAYGMSVAKRFVELILRWRHQIGRLEDAAYRDPLTGLANRQVFFDALEQERRGGAVLYCDLDRFKPVNDALGHLAGDALLRQVADRLCAHVRADDLVARLGGDEFAVLLRGASPDQATELAVRLTQALDAPFDLSGEQVSVGISIGMAHTDGRLGEQTLEQADRALYASKASRR